MGIVGVGEECRKRLVLLEPHQATPIKRVRMPKSRTRKTGRKKVGFRMGRKGEDRGREEEGERKEKTQEENQVNSSGDSNRSSLNEKVTWHERYKEELESEPVRVHQLSEAVKQPIKKVIDTKIWPWRKFYADRSEIVQTNLAFIFKQIGWTGTQHAHQRMKYWDAILDYVFERMGQKRTCSITSTTAFANGK